MLLYVGLIVSYLPPALEKINPKIAQVHLDPQDLLKSWGQVLAHLPLGVSIVFHDDTILLENWVLLARWYKT